MSKRALLVPAHLLVLGILFAAAPLPEGTRALRDLEYVPGGHERHKLDLYLPGTGSNWPLIVAVHGGAWTTGSKQSEPAGPFVARGFAVASINYRLSQHAIFPAQIEDCKAAVRWLRANAPKYGYDAKRVGAIGGSAGGHLVAMMLSCRWKQVAQDLPTQLLVGGLSISGLFDLEPLRHAPFLQPDLKLTPGSVARLSPAFFPRPRNAPLYSVAGGDESEEFIRQARLIRDVWGPTAVPVCETVSAANHLTVLTGLADPEGRLHELALRLLGLR